jgi:hypothetical protein
VTRARSANKTDHRSDLTALVGLAFFLLTATAPSTLRDECNSAPHQRGGALERLRVAGLHLPRLLNFFDRGFAQELDRRFQSAGEIEEALRLLYAPAGQTERDADAILKRIRERPSTQEAEAQALLERMRHLSDQFREVTRSLVEAIGHGVYYTETGRGIDVATATMSHRIGFVRATDPEQEVWPLYRVTQTGTEIVVSVEAPNSPAFVLRNPVHQAGLTADDLERLRRFLLRGSETIL